MNKYAIIVAGGSGTRMGGSVPKQFLMLRNKPLLWYTISAFHHAFNDVHVILVLPEYYLKSGEEMISSLFTSRPVEIIAGGPTRFQSVKNGLALVPEGVIVFVHDGVRCLVTPHLIQECHEAATGRGNAIPAVSATDTIRIETASGNEMADRTKIRIIQTPQTFLSTGLKKAYEQEYKDSFTDDASVLESLGERIHLVEGDVMNIKITRQVDLLIAEQILKERGER